MAERDPGSGQAALEVRQQGAVVGDEILEAAGVALERVGERTVRQPLPAPVDRGDRVAARDQVAGGTAIFLDA